MQIEAYIIAWNEADTIAFTIKHYQSFCTRIILFDNYSTDQTSDIARSLGCEVMQFGQQGQLSDKAYLKVKNNAWKESKADWVIVVDSDEILWHENISKILHDARFYGHTIFKTYGWQVFSNDMPRESFFEIRTGFHDNNYSKSVIFNPNKMTSINYTYGCHTANPRGDIVYSNEVLTLYHYRNIGGIQRLADRHKQYRKRMSPLNIELGLGCHYLYDDNRRRKEWEEHLKNSVEYCQVGG